MGARQIGQVVKRVEDKRLLTGKGRYVDDIKLPGMLHGAFVRSSLAHARISGIDVRAAQQLPGVHAILTMDDFGPEFARKRMPQTFPHPLLKQGRVQYPLAQDEVCYVGEAIALVLADNRYIAEDAAALVEVDYDALPAVADCLLAAVPGAARVHDGAPDNIAGRIAGKFGDVERVFAGAAHVFQERYTLHRGGCHSMECRGVIARYEADEDQLTVWSSTQSPYPVSRFVADYLGRDENRTRVIAPNVGGGFGPKAAVYPEEIALSLAAMTVGRPVKWIEDRREHFLSTTQQRDQIWDVEIAAAADGRMLGLRGHVIHDNGAYVPYGLLLPLTSLSPMPGPYALEAIDLTVDVVYTNAVPTSPVRGAGRPYAAFILERAIDLIAIKLGLDRAEVRRRSMVRPEQMPYQTGMKYRDGSLISYDSGDYPKCLDMALELADYAGFRARQEAARREGRYLGIGIGSYIEDTGIGPYEGATVRVQRNGKVVILTGAASQGQGHATIFAQICADQLGVDLSQIEVESGDTGRFPMGIGTIGSRIAVTAGSSVFQAAGEVREKALKVAAEILEAAEIDLELRDGAVSVVGIPGHKVTLAEIAHKLISSPGVALPGAFSAGLEATAYFSPGTKTPYANGTNVAEVEVDIETGDVKILRYSVGHDCGTLLNPMLVDGQIVGGVVHGIGNALYERMMFDGEGQPITMNYGEYLLPLASEMPHISIVHMESPSPLNPLGVKGAGEGGTIPAAPTIIAAIEDALAPFDVRIASHPVSPAEIVRLIEGASAP